MGLCIQSPNETVLGNLRSPAAVQGMGAREKYCSHTSLPSSRARGPEAKHMAERLLAVCPALPHAPIDERSKTAGLSNRLLCPWLENVLLCAITVI